MTSQIVTQPSVQQDRFNPQLPPQDNAFEDYEELYPKEEHELVQEEIIFMSLRCLTVFLCIVGLVLLLINIGRGNRLKSWRLYFLVALTVFSWIGMTLYQDHFDYYFVQEVTRYPNPRSIYWCFRNLLHGLTLYLIILVLAHLSDMQHRSNWLGLIAIVIFVPIIYSVGVLVADLRLGPKERNHKHANTVIESVRVLLYNIISTILLFVMSRSFCTTTLYGTYSEQRSGVVVIVARWTYAFLLIHNLVTCTSYAINCVTRYEVQGEDIDLSTLTLIHKILEEVAVFVIVLAIPTSYLIGLAAQCCCGVSRDNDMEMDKVDKIYSDTWTTPSLRNGGSTATQMTTTSPAVNTSTTSGLQNGVVRRPRSAASNTSSSLNSSFDSIGELPSVSRVGSNPRGNDAARKKRVRESYLEAVSTGSLDHRGSISSVSSEPIDL